MKQKTRLMVLLLYVFIIFLASYYLYNSILPPSIEKSIWILSGLSSAILGNLLVTPYFTKPVDTLSYSIVTLITIYTMSNWTNWSISVKIIFTSILVYMILMIISAIISIYLNDSHDNISQKIAKTSLLVTNNFGTHEILFSLVILFSIVLYHSSNIKEYMTILLLWVVMVIIKPENFLFSFINKIRKIWLIRNGFDFAGVIAGFTKPNLLTVRQTTSIEYKKGDIFIYKNDFKKLCFATFLNYIGRDEDILFRAIDLLEEDLYNLKDDYKEEYKSIPENVAIKVSGKEDNIYSDVIGTVDIDSDIDHIYVELIDSTKIIEGKLIETRIKGESVLYQIINGTSTEEIIHKKNKYGYDRAIARKIGVWDNAKRKFVNACWMPEINSPVFIAKEVDFEPSLKTIGKFPESKYYVDINNINELVTHNTAILGILGIGKSMLSIELIERMISEKIKVVCLDLTDQYAKELSDFYNQKEEEERIKIIIDAGNKDREIYNDNPENGGSYNNLSQAIFNDIKAFSLDEHNYLKIYNPSKLFGTKQTQEPKSYSSGGQWFRSAGIWTLTPVEITRIISEQVLDIFSTEMTDKARVCLVLEEAHSLVPEFSSVASDGDKNATNGTSRVILQGRKYGIGTLVITQRTANVTKTILNQCNTIFAMRTFDDTSKSFLSNFIGKDYTEVLSSLKERQAIFYGKGSSCDNPVLLRLNDRSDFIDIYRKSE